MDFTTFGLAILSAMLINNVILLQLLGICPFLGVSKKIESAIGMSAAVAFVMLLASIAAWSLNKFVLVPLEITYISTIAYILVIASLVQFVEMFIKKFSAGLYKSLGVYLPLITTNCAILGVAQQNVALEYDFVMMIATTLGTALGFGLVMFAYSAIRERLDSNDVPRAFQGVPIALIVACIMAAAFTGFSGVIVLG